MQSPLAWRAEEACLNAWPALRHVIVGDWTLRFSDGLSRRANSANPLRADAASPIADLAWFEQLYHAQALPLIFRLPSLLDPAVVRDLDRRGFTAEGETCTLHGSLAAMAAKSDPDVSISSSADEDWIDAFNSFHGRSEAERLTYRRIVSLIALPVAFVKLHEQGVVSSVAMGALNGDMLCVESVITDSRHRGKGAARRMLGAMFAWAIAQGAKDACLQVEASNTNARRLYHHLGMTTELSRYHYRRQR